MNSHRFSPNHVIMLLISCLIVLGCYSPDWSDKDADFLITQIKTNPCPDYFLRGKAVLLLAKKTQERDKVIPVLTYALLNDEYQTVRVDAARSLVGMKPSAVSAIPALTEALQREDRGRPLESLSSLTDWNLHVVVIESLGEMGPDAVEAIPALLELFRSERDFWDDAALAILKIDPSMRDLVKEELIEKRAVRPLAVLAEEGDVSLVPVLIQLLNNPNLPHPHTHGRAARALKDIGTLEALDAAVAYYTQRLGSRTAWARLRAAHALKDIGTPEALDAAVPVFIQLLNAPEDYERDNAARALKDIGTPEALDAVNEFEKRRWWPF